MKSLSLLTLCLVQLACALAQTTGNNTITGTVKDSLTKTPLEYATITLFAKNTSTPVTGTVTDKSGKFSIKGIGNAVFTLVFECIGYKPITIKDMQLNQDRSVAYHMGILLPQEKNILKGVTVVAQSKLIENKIDKLVYNAEKDLTSQTGVATDILKKVPQVSIDADGNVELSGSSGVRFLINGKPSTAFGSNIADVLQSIPASQIKSIEVITNPGAKYDAQGIGGIINIILKSNKAKGYNGNLSLSAGTRLENGSFNFAARNNNFGINAFVSGNKKLKVTTPAWSDRKTTDSATISSLYQMGNFEFERHSYQAGLGFDWTIKKYHSLSGAVSFNNFGSSNAGTTNQNFQPSNLVNSPAILSRINTDNNFDLKNIDASLNYTRTFAREDQQLEIGINTSFGKDRKSFVNEQFLLPQDSLYYGTSSKNPGTIKETEITIDYTQPLKKETTLGFGGKASFYTVNSASDIQEYQPSFKKYLPNIALSDDLLYKQKVYAAYAELSFPVADWFNTKIGARYERTEISSFFSNAQKQVAIPGYNTLVPSIYLTKKLSGGQTLKLSYSKRIERPDYEDLNPFVNTNDPKNLTTGNPYLQPELGHRIEMGYIKDIGKKGSIMFTLFYRINDHDIQPFIIYHSSYMVGDTVYNNVSVNTRENIGRENNMGLNIFANYAVTPKLNLRTNIAMFRRHTINVLNSGYDYSSFNYRFNVNASYQFSKTVLAEFFGNFRSVRHEAQGTFPSFTTYNLALRKQFWKQKGSLALTADNFLHEYITQNTTLNGPAFSSTGVRKIPSRSFGLNFTWKFGKLEIKKSKPENEPKDNPQGE